MGTVLLDCDGVLADFVGHVSARLAEVGHVIPEVTSYDFIRGFGPEVGAAARTLLKDPDTWKTMPPYEEAQRGVEALRSVGHTIVVVTSPWLSCHTWAHVRREWLDKHFDVDSGDLIVTSRKELVGGDAFVDDRIESVASWAIRNPKGHALLMDRPWTRDPRGFVTWDVGWTTALHNRIIGAGE
jgi:5'(3')-deoxyribonucleotidase